MVWHFTGPFAFLVSIPLFFYGWEPVASILSIFLLLTALVTAELSPAPQDIDDPRGSERIFRLLPILYVPLHLGVTVWALWTSALPELSWLSFASLSLSIGVLSGVFGMLAAHDLIHSPKRLEKELGILMLSFMTYRHFRISHIYGHHRWVATERDPGSAKLGESFYAFFARTLIGQVRQAWAFEELRIEKKGLSRLSNRVIQDFCAYLVIYGAVFALFGLRAVLFLGLSSFLAVVVLELFNYIAHYGLTRARLPNGRYERLTEQHSWNTSNPLANRLIFNMGRHSDHHRHATAAYQTLRQVDQAPELPAGYAGSILLALMPPLWRKLMDPEVQRIRARAPGVETPVAI